jgi:ADP-ribose pyrophosphatase
MKDPENLSEPVTDRRVEFAGRYMEVETLTVLLPDGRSAQREVVRVRDAVAVLPLEEDGTVYLVRQYRPAIGKTLIEIPAGLVDRGESPEKAALRECGEEIGRSPGKLVRLVHYAHAEGYSTGFITLYAGLDLGERRKPELDRTEFLEHLTMPFQDLLNLVKENKIYDSKTILSVVLWNERR